MRILHELNQLNMGGAERVVAGIIRHDKENKHTVFSYKDGPMKDVLIKAGAEVIVEKEGEQPDVKLDLIHVHTGGAPSLMLNQVKGIFPAVETIHSPVVSQVRDEYVTKRVGVSNVVTKKNRKCVTIYNGIDLERLILPEDKKGHYKSKLGIPINSFVIGRLGRVAMDKCVEEFLIACWKFQKMHPEKDNIYVIIAGGETDKGYLAKVKVAAASLPLKNVRFIEETQDVAPIYAAMDVFLYPSPTEGFGLVYAEAMASGVPVITWENDVTREILMGTAWITKADIDSLVRGLNFMYKDETNRMNIATLGNKYAMQMFDERRMSEDYQKLYKSLGVDETKEFKEENVTVQAAV